jgi:hypothetical protein
MYIAEIAPPKIRGNLVAWNQFAITFGMLVIYFVNFGNQGPVARADGDYMAGSW